MANLINTLYPPIVATFMPAFLYNQDAIVFFSLSSFNTASEIKKVHVSVVNQLNNESVVKNSNEIIICPLEYDTSKGMYYITIHRDELINNQFNINQFYKIQIRFDNCDKDLNLNNDQADKILNNYLTNNQSYFSEWSSVCLIRPISEPFIPDMKPFSNSEQNKIYTLNKGILHLSGRVYFGNSSSNEVYKEETETIQSYQIKILKEDSDIILTEYPIIYTGENVNPNDINYRVDLQSLNTDEERNFRLQISIITTNQYSKTFIYNFQIADFIEDEDFDPVIEVKMDDEEGIAYLTVKNTQSLIGTIYIKRGSSIDNFKKYEDICVKQIRGPVNIEIADNTVSSLVWYRYSVQYERTNGALSPVVKSLKFLPNFYDAILSRAGQQLKLQYNYNISNFKPIVNRTKIDTLGGKYPKFAENAILNYKQFSISGTIAADLDAHELFLNKLKYFGENGQYYNYLTYKNENDVQDIVRNDLSDYNLSDSSGFLTSTKDDWLWEREFREEVIKWLNDGEPKLYRSISEGAMVVMLTDVSLTPNRTLSRLIWDFSATVYEIAEANSLEELDTLGIYETTKLPESISQSGPSDPEPYINCIKVGQLFNYKVTKSSSNTDSGVNIVTEIYNRLVEKYAGVLSNRRPDEIYLKNVKIFFHSPPNIFYEDSKIVNESWISNLIYISDVTNSSYNDSTKMKLGYTFNVNDSKNSIFVNEKGYYQLPNNIDVTSLIFNQEDTVTIEYTVVYKEKNNVENIVSNAIVDKTIVGQYQGEYKAGEKLGEKIRNKYNFISDTYSQKMQYWKGISVEVTPYSILNIKYKNEDNYNEYVVGETGILYLLKDFKISDLYFSGRRMVEVSESRQPYLEEWEYIVDTNTYNSVDQIASPKNNTVYDINNEYIIFYQNNWYNFKKKNRGTGVAEVPIEGIINYYGDIVQSNF